MRFAAKKLTRSDLTFFECQFRRLNVGNQKAINLNANVFVDVLFPLAKEEAAGQPKQFPVPVWIYGPGLRSRPHCVPRKIIAAGRSQKNWRLNGEFVSDPEFDPSRYHNLLEGDIAIFGFDEHEGLPSTVTIVLISQLETVDTVILEQLFAVLDKRSMSELSNDVLVQISSVSVEGHPIRALLNLELDEALDEAALGGATGTQRLLRSHSIRRMTADALARRRTRAEAVGRDGEALIDAYLRNQLSEAEIENVTWISDENAINPWDFEIVDNDRQTIRVEVKSTAGPFERKLHISQAEIIQAADQNAPRTDLYRVYALSDNDAWLQVSEDIRVVALEILRLASRLGKDVEPDGYSVSPSRFKKWSTPIRIKLSDEDDA